MAFFITKKAKKAVIEFEKCRLEFSVPPNLKLEVAYRIPAEKEKRAQMVGGYLYLKLGNELFPAIVEFSRDEVKLIGERITKEQFVIEAVTRGKIFFHNKEICTCWEFALTLIRLPLNSFTIVEESNRILMVSAYGQANAVKGKGEFTILF